MAIGTVTQVIGAVVDVKFPLDAIPAIYNALKAKISFAGTERHITLEVQQHLEDGVVRTVAMTSTEGLRRGSPAEDTGSPITVPVGNATLGRIFNVTGDPVDEKGEMTSCQRLPIHRNPPPLVDQSTRAEILETGIKPIDLICPFLKGGKVGAFEPGFEADILVIDPSMLHTTLYGDLSPAERLEAYCYRKPGEGLMDKFVAGRRIF